MRPPGTTRRAALRSLGGLGVAAVVAGCSDTPASSGTGTVATPPPAAVSPTTPAPSPSAVVASGTPGVPQDITTGLQVPWDLAFLPDGTALVTLRDAARVVQAGPGLLTPVPSTGPDGTVPDVEPAGEGGLLGIALSPTFSEDAQVFLYLTSRDDNRVVRFTLDGGRLVDSVPVLTGVPKNTTHNGGRLRFGPDHLLYVGTGDAQNRPAAQDVNALGGKVLRIARDGSVPDGNPFPGSRTWSYGHRNPQGFGWDSTGRMIAAEFGQDRFDELNVIRPGGNYGWPEVEGPGDGGGRFVAPLQTWTTDQASPSGIAVTSDAVYVAALRGQKLWRVPLNPDGPTGTPDAYLDGTLGRLRAVEPAPDGSLWVLTSNTFRGDPRPGDDRLVSVPLS